ncbi:hypothetical protein C8R42DRAFT_715470 [Lentinula raphanica]|nr:hypothetical protein C8R42DRAFT_715470 [Lentinula raphanica]
MSEPARRSVLEVPSELEEIEAVHGLYPATIPFLKLLSTLIHTPKRIPLKDRVSDQASTNTIPESLGQPYRLPGIGPFVNFVIDNVFSKISLREYRRPSERRQMNDLCLAFIKRILASYDMESLLASAEEGSLKESSVVQYLVHPGYEVMKRMLTSLNLQGVVLSYVVEGLLGFEKGFAEEEPFFKSTIIRVLRIVHRVLEIQDIFLDVLVPLTSEFDSAPLIGTIHPRSHFIKLDQALSFGTQYVPAVAAYVAYPTHFEVVLLSVKIIDILSASSAFSNLAALIARSEDSDRILGRYIQLLDVESSEDISLAEVTAEQITGAGAPDMEDMQVSLEQATRTAVLDLLIHNTEPRRRFPNVAHYLLFGGTDFEQGIQDPHALGRHNACVHVLLQLVNTGIPTSKGKAKHTKISATPLFVTLPALAERCYHVIYQLCMLQEPSIEIQYNDGSRVVTTVSTLSCFLRLRSWIFDLVALDLHVLANKGRTRNISEVLDILFGNESVLDESVSWQEEVFRPFREIGQSHLKIIEFLLAEVNLQACLRKDAAGCEIIDRSSLLMLLTTARRALFAHNKIVTPVQAQQLEAETSYILESSAIENHRRQVVHAVSTGFEAWRRVLDITLTSGSLIDDKTPTEVWKTVAFMLLDSLVQLSPLEKQHPVLIPLKRHGILSNFVQGIKESDSLLQSILKPDPDDLNPLYVYESKMSFFICMAETRAGAERPESDSSFVDHDSSLPSAIQRYHNLFMPSLQIVVAMLATLGGKHATASNQALDFISRHSATIVILLKNETGYFSLALLEELDLLVTLCAEVLPLVPRSEMASTHSGFGAINAAILGLSTKCLGSGTWTDAIKPVTDGEVLHASVVAPGFGSHSNIPSSTRRLPSSNHIPSIFNLMFSPAYVASRYDERSSHYLATIPTIGDALEVLNLLCQDLAATLKQMSDIFAELSAKDLIAIVGDLDLGFIKDLEIGQKRNLICRQLEKMIMEAQRDSKTTLNTLEMLLLLSWRHIMSYAEGTHPHPLNTSTATAVRLISSPDPGEFRLQIPNISAPNYPNIEPDVDAFDARRSKNEREDVQVARRKAAATNNVSYPSMYCITLDGCIRYKNASGVPQLSISFHQALEQSHLHPHLLPPPSSDLTHLIHFIQSSSWPSGPIVRYAFYTHPASRARLLSQMAPAIFTRFATTPTDGRWSDMEGSNRCNEAAESRGFGSSTSGAHSPHEPPSTRSQESSQNLYIQHEPEIYMEEHYSAVASRGCDGVSETDNSNACN